MKKINLLILSALLLLSACSPQRRLANLIAQHPELAETYTVADTLTVIHTDSIIAKGWIFDTIVNIKDSFVIKDGLNTVTLTKTARGLKAAINIPDKTIHYSDTIEVPYIDTIYNVKHIPISDAEVWKYRKQGAGILIGVVLTILVIISIIKIYFKI